MNQRKAALLGIALAMAAWAASPPAALADGDLWIVDFNKAKETAAKDGKDILMEFTGSDWCPPCMQLKKVVFDSEFFQKEAPKHFVLLKLDYPRDTSKQTKEEIQQNEELAKQFPISGYPTVILVDAAGKPYASTGGYGGTAAEEYTKALVAKVDVRKQRDKLFVQAEEAKGVEKAKLLDKALGVVDSDLVVSGYRGTVEEIIKLDDKDEAGLKKKYGDVLKTARVNQRIEEIQDLARRDGFGPAGEKVDVLIKEEKLTGALLQEALWLKAVCVFRDGKKDASRKVMDAAIAAAPDSERAAEIKQIIQRVFPKVDEPKKKTEKTKVKKEAKEKE